MKYKDLIELNQHYIKREIIRKIYVNINKTIIRQFPIKFIHILILVKRKTNCRIIVPTRSNYFIYFFTKEEKLIDRSKHF